MHFPKLPLLKALHSLSGRVLLILIMVVINVFALTVIFFLLHKGQRSDAVVQQAFRRKDYMSGCPEENGYFGSNRACNEFFVCLNGTAYRMFCKSGLQWNGQSKHCVSLEQSDCGKRFECPQPMGLFRNPEDCFSYYSCAYGIPYLMDCPTPLQWSSQTQRCEWAENSDCGRNIPIPTRPPVPQPTLSTPATSTDSGGSSSSTVPMTTTPKFTFPTTTVSSSTTNGNNANDHSTTESVTSVTPSITTPETTTNCLTTTQQMTTEDNENVIVSTTESNPISTSTTESNANKLTTTLSSESTTENMSTTTNSTIEILTTTSDDSTTTTKSLSTTPDTITTTLFTQEPDTHSTIEMQTTSDRPQTTTIESWTTVDSIITTTNSSTDTSVDSTTGSSSTNATPSPFVCPDVNGYFADPTSCEHYYLCLRGQSTRKQCPLGKQFNSKQLSCNWPSLSDCGGPNLI